MGKSFKHVVVAEGIETQEHKAYLRTQVMETEKSTVTLSRIWSGRRESNAVSEAWEAGNKILKTLELAALSNFADRLNWKMNGK